MSLNNVNGITLWMILLWVAKDDWLIDEESKPQQVKPDRTILTAHLYYREISHNIRKLEIQKKWFLNYEEDTSDISCDYELQKS